MRRKISSALSTEECRKGKKPLQAGDDGEASGDENVDGDAEVGDVHIDLSADGAERDVDLYTRIKGNRDFLEKKTIQENAT